jgi:hypothetical protein
MEPRPDSIAKVEIDSSLPNHPTKAEVLLNASAALESPVLSAVSHEHITSHPADPSIVPTDGRCFFLALPQELRGVIYAFVVETEGKVRMHENRDKRWKTQVSYEEEEEWVQVDRLQDVFRQLRSETQERGVHFNEVTFMCEQNTGTYQLKASSKTISAGLTLTRLTSFPSLYSQVHSHLRKVIAYDKPRIEHKTLGSFMRQVFVRFCERNP